MSKELEIPQKTHGKLKTPKRMAEIQEDSQSGNEDGANRSELNTTADIDRENLRPIVEGCDDNDDADESENERPNEDDVNRSIEMVTQEIAPQLVAGSAQVVVPGQGTLTPQPVVIYQTYGSIKRHEDRLTIMGHLVLAIIFGNVTVGDKFAENYLIMAVCIFSLPIIFDYVLCSGAHKEIFILVAIPFALIKSTMSISLALKDEFKAIFIFWAAFIILIPKMSTGMRLTCVANLTGVLILTQNYQWLFLPILTASAVIFYAIMSMSKNNQRLENILHRISWAVQFLFVVGVAVYVVMPFDLNILFGTLFSNHNNPGSAGRKSGDEKPHVFV